MSRTCNIGDTIGLTGNRCRGRGGNALIFLIDTGPRSSSDHRVDFDQEPGCRRCPQCLYQQGGGVRGFLTAVVGLYNDMEITGSIQSAVEAHGGCDWVRLTPHETVERAAIEGDTIGMAATFIEATARQPLPITNNDPLF